MSKQEFKEILEHGKCPKCNEHAARAEHTCANSAMQGNWAHDNGGMCNCCVACEDRCDAAHMAIVRIFNDIAKQTQEEIDKEIVKGLKNEQR